MKTSQLKRVSFVSQFFFFFSSRRTLDSMRAHLQTSPNGHKIQAAPLNNLRLCLISLIKEQYIWCELVEYGMFRVSEIKYCVSALLLLSCYCDCCDALIWANSTSIFRIENCFVLLQYSCIALKGIINFRFHFPEWFRLFLSISLFFCVFRSLPFLRKPCYSLHLLIPFAIMVQYEKSFGWFFKFLWLGVLCSVLLFCVRHSHILNIN